MALIDLSILILLVTGLILSIIELGLSAYVVHLENQLSSYYDPYTRTTYTYRTRSIGQVNYLVFCSLWGMLVSALLLAVPFVFRSRSTGRLFGIGSLVLNTLTMIFWLAGFAALSALYGGYAAGGYAGALLAFAVLPWLVWLALTVLNFLTAFGILSSERPGHHKLFSGRRGVTTGTGTTSAPMSTVGSSTV